jgi:hypothetical protein
MNERFRFIQDEDGHWYIINVKDVHDFYDWVRWTMSDMLEGCDLDFESARCHAGIGDYTFENVKVKP